MITLDIQLVSPQMGTAIPVPQYATEGSAAMDLHACLDAAITLMPQRRVTVPTGIAIGLPSAGHVALVFARSGLAMRHGVALSNGVGVIDSDYRGEIQVGLINQGEKAYTIRPGDRIAQLAVIPVEQVKLCIKETLTQTERGAGGFGSTGI